MSRQLIAAVLVPLLACAQHIRVRHRDGVSPDVVRQAASAGTIHVTEAELTPAFRVLGKQAPVWERPLEAARQLFGVPERSGTFLYEVRTRRLMPVAPDGPMLGEISEQEFVRDYFQWCNSALGPGDCLRILEKNRTYSSHARYVTALTIGWQSAMGEMRESLRDLVSPAAVMGTIFAAMGMYLMLWIAPEPFSKGIAAAMTIWLIGYFGFDPLWRLAKAWKQLVDEADAAPDFETLRRAGERFGERSGPAAARLLVLITTVAIGGAASMAARGTSLPGFPLANVQAEGQLAVNLVTATAVESVAVGTQTVTITFAPGLLAMAAASPRPAVQGRAPSSLHATKVNPLQGTRYSEKVRAQMRPHPKTGRPDNHGFPLEVDNSAGLGRQTTIKGSDGITRIKVELDGSYNGSRGTFEWIIEPEGVVNHRLFVPKEGKGS